MPTFAPECGGPGAPTALRFRGPFGILWETNGRRGEYHEKGRVLRGGSADSRAYVVDARGSRTAELSLVGSADADILANMLLDFGRVHPDRRDATIAELGGTAALALRLLPWHRVDLR